MDRHDPRLAVLTEPEARCLAAILRKLRAASPDAIQNQTESNTAIEAEAVESEA